MLALGRSSGAAGGQGLTKVRLDSDINLVGLQLDIGFDPAVVTPGTAQRGDALGSPFRVASSVVRPGVLRVLVYSESNSLLRDGNVVSLPVTFNQTVPAGQRGLELLEVQLADARGMRSNYALGPFVEITTPAAGARLEIGQPVAVEVEAVPGTGSLQAVQFLIDGQLVGQRAQAPFSVSWTPAERGGHTLLVVASDEGTTTADDGRTLYVRSRIDAWKEEYFSATQQANPFVSGFGADPDGDGAVNGIEYLAGTHPLLADGNAPLTTQLVEIGGEFYLTVTLESPSAVNDLSFSVFASGKAGRDTGAGRQPAVLVETTAAGGLVRRVYRDPVPFTDSSRFMYIESTLRP